MSTAVAASGAEDITGEAFGVDPDGDWFVRVDLSPDEGEVFAVVCADAVEVAAEFTKIGRHLNDFLAGDQSFRAASVFDELCDGA